MDGEQNGSQEATTGAQDQEAQEQQSQGSQGQQEVGGGIDYEAAIAERDARIAELEGQVAEAAKTAETAEALRGEIAELRQASADERIDFKLQLAGCRNVKAARAILDDHEGDIDKLKEAEPWLFEAAGKHAKGGAGDGATGTTGLPNAGAASDEGKTLKHWREIAGLPADDKQ